MDGGEGGRKESRSGGRAEGKKGGRKEKEEERKEWMKCSEGGREGVKSGVEEWGIKRLCV